jgi:hypothetical protein
MSAQTLLSSGDKWYSYSGSVIGDVSVPATIQLILIPNTGLRDSLIELQPFYGQPESTSSTQQLGIVLKSDDVEIYRNQGNDYRPFSYNEQIRLFIPRQSKLEVISLNTSGSNTQLRGANLIGYYL